MVELNFETMSKVSNQALEQIKAAEDYAESVTFDNGFFRTEFQNAFLAGLAFGAKQRMERDERIQKRQRDD